MRRFCVITSVLIAAVGSAAAQMTIPLPVMPVRKGVIQNVQIEPAQPTPSTAITCRITVADNVRLDKVQKQRLGSTFMVKVYWIDPPVGEPEPPSPVEHAESLGTLAPGFYTVLVQSLYGGRLVDTKHAMFRVNDAPINPPSYIDEVWVEPEQPITGEQVTLYVAGEWGSPGYRLVGLATIRIQNQIIVRMYWLSPSANVPQVVTPYERELSLFTLREGTYSVTVYCYRNNRLVDSEHITFDVEGPLE